MTVSDSVWERVADRLRDLKTRNGYLAVRVVALTKSRDMWKGRARKYATDNMRLRQKARRQQRRAEMWRTRALAAKEER